MTEPAAADSGGPAYTLALPRRPQSARDARELMASALSAWDLTDDDGQVGVIVSELVSNTVRHATEATVWVSVRRMGPSTVRIGVADRSDRMPIARSEDLSAVHGRGLVLVDSLSEGRWGVDVLPVGKRVWAEVSVTEGGHS
ncbi:ATP-binding protein [Streptomyces sp. SID3343]|nr:ATP-binding protein [Streptomyces sp. SID3343]